MLGKIEMEVKNKKKIKMKNEKKNIWKGGTDWKKGSPKSKKTKSKCAEGPNPDVWLCPGHKCSLT